MSQRSRKACARDVQTAKDALKPAEVWESIRQHKLPAHKRDLRHNAAFVRQGEWFFIPRPALKVNEKLTHKNEPIRRGAGKPHVCQFLHREGGEQVYATAAYPKGLTLRQFYRGVTSDRQRREHTWRPMVRCTGVWLKSTIRHGSQDESG